MIPESQIVGYLIAAIISIFGAFIFIIKWILCFFKELNASNEAREIEHHALIHSLAQELKHEVQDIGKTSDTILSLLQKKE